MDERFKIYVDQLRDGGTESILEEFSPEFMDVNEKDLKFTDPVKVKGEAYLAEHELVLHLDITTTCIIPCSICNEPVKVPVEITGFYHAVPLNEVKGAIFDFQEILRETILLQTPLLAECKQGKCPQRDSLKKYLKPQDASNPKDNGDGYRPFAGLDIDHIK